MLEKSGTCRPLGEMLTPAAAAQRAEVDERTISFWMDFGYLTPIKNAGGVSVNGAELDLHLYRTAKNLELVRKNRNSPHHGWQLSNCPACGKLLPLPTQPHRRWVCSEECRGKFLDHELPPVGTESSDSERVGTAEQSPGWLGNPDYAFDFDRLPANVIAKIGDQFIAESDRVHISLEQGHSPLYYFPADSVDMKLLVPSAHETYCHYKGYAKYWDFIGSGTERRQLAWTYEAPFEEVMFLRGFVGFMWHAVDLWYEDGIPVTSPRDIKGRIGPGLTLKALYPKLAREWHVERNPNIRPYEVSPTSKVEVWWDNGTGRVWREAIRSRVLSLPREA